MLYDEIYKKKKKKVLEVTRVTKYIIKILDHILTYAYIIQQRSGNIFLQGGTLASELSRLFYNM